MPEGTGGGISPDAAFNAIQGQLSQIQGSMSSLGGEMGEVRQEVSDTKAATQQTTQSLGEVRKDVRKLDKTLHGNGGTGLVVRVDRIERAHPDEEEINPVASTQDLAAQHVGLQMFKWQTIKDLGSKGYKIAIVVLLLVLGYKELARLVLGAPPAPKPDNVRSETPPDKPAMKNN